MTQYIRITQAQKIRRGLLRLGMDKELVELILKETAHKMIPYGKTLVGCADNTLKYHFGGYTTKQLTKERDKLLRIAKEAKARLQALEN